MHRGTDDGGSDVACQWRVGGGFEAEMGLAILTICSHKSTLPGSDIES